MKYKLATLFAFLILLAPTMTFAATQDELQVQYQTSLKQVIALLIQEVQQLQALLAAQQAGDTSVPAVTGVTITTQATTPMPEQQQVSCSLTLGAEGSNQVLRDGVWTTSPSGKFALSWSFPAGAVGTLMGGTLNQPSGSMYVQLEKDGNGGYVSATYTLDVSEEGFTSNSCSVTAVSGQ